MAIHCQGEFEAARGILALLPDHATEKELQDKYVQAALSQAEKKGYKGVLELLFDKVAGIKVQEVQNGQYRRWGCPLKLSRVCLENLCSSQSP